MKLFMYIMDMILRNLPPFFGLAKKPEISPGIHRSAILMTFFFSMASTSWSKIFSPFSEVGGFLLSCGVRGRSPLQQILYP